MLRQAVECRTSHFENSAQKRNIRLKIAKAFISTINICLIMIRILYIVIIFFKNYVTCPSLTFVLKAIFPLKSGL